MDYVKYCKEPRFFLKIYNSLSANKQFEFETVFEQCKNAFEEQYDNKLFHPTITFEDCTIIIKQDTSLMAVVDLKEEMENKTIISEDLLEDILQEFNTCHGLYVSESPQDTNKEYPYRIDHDEICESIERILN